MSETFQIITLICYGKDSDVAETVRDHCKQSMMYDPDNDAWYLGEWIDDNEERA